MSPRASPASCSAAAPTATTCACDAAKDGVTNPAPINGNTRASLSADDDGGYFKRQARAYYKARRAYAAAVTVVACLGDSITEGSPYWDSRRRKR